ncbi:hypothetical protein HNY73_005071 [Argiope bruennichi]|uniref:Uncharacterized protein n=1 Tax=Argiope bruennichi TaxID=94029 RepID=A0A8T0FKT6_ARGBR|nr:hypothetical protein HNY73_005071 [Argiope bruennichi]
MEAILFRAETHRNQNHESNSYFDCNKAFQLIFFCLLNYFKRAGAIPFPGLYKVPTAQRQTILKSHPPPKSTSYPKSDHGTSASYLLCLTVLSILYNDSTEGVKMCGRRLADLLNFIWEKHGGFHAPGAKREGSNASYCANSQNVENIDLGEMVPPGSEIEISPENITEFIPFSERMAKMIS